MLVLLTAGVFLIDPHGVLRWMSIHDLGVAGRNVDEVIRVLDALQNR